MKRDTPRRWPFYTGLGLIGVLLVVLAILFNTAQVEAAVILTQFSATGGDTQVSVRWTTASEINTSGFYVVASDSASGTFTRVSPFIPRKGTGISGASYEFIHIGLTNGIPVYYKLEIINIDLTSIFTGTISATPNQATSTPSVTPSPSSTASFTPSATFTASVSPTASTTFTPSMTFTPSPTGSSTASATLTMTPSKTPTKTLTVTLIPSYTPKPKTSTPSKTVVKIKSSTPTKTLTKTITPTLGSTTPTVTQSGGSGYPNLTPSVTFTGPELTGTAAALALLTPSEGGGYPGGGTQSITSEATGANATSQGAGNLTVTPTPQGGKKAGTGSTIGWIIGLLVLAGALGGAAWFYIRNRKPGSPGTGSDLFNDDPEN